MLAMGMMNLFPFCLALSSVSYVILHSKIFPKNQLFSTNSKKVFPLKCWSMFNVGVQRYSLAGGTHNSNEHRKLGNGVAPATSYYEDLSSGLPSLLKTLPNGTADLLHSSRLQITGGKISYLDSGIRMYEAAEVKKCSELRRKGQDRPLWIVFVGDSKIRDKFVNFLDVTPNFNWFVYNHTLKEKTSTAWKTYTLAHKTKLHRSGSFKGDNDAKVDLIWAAKGLQFYNKFSLAGNELKFWAYEASRIPDVVIIGFGSWSILSGTTNDRDSLIHFSECGDEWLAIAKVLDALSKRTSVLAWAQTRFREFSSLASISAIPVYERVSQTVSKDLTLQERLDRIFHYSRRFTWSAEWIDEVTHMALRNTGVIIWDSGMSRHPTYSAHSCHDDIHNDVFTLRDENMMIINLLCNEYIEKGSGTYCCPDKQNDNSSE